MDTTRIHELERQVKHLERKLEQEKAVSARIMRSCTMKLSLNNVHKKERIRIEQYMTLLLDNSKDIILLFDKDGRIAYATQSYLDITGIKAFGEIERTLLSDLLGTILPKTFIDELRAMIGGEQNGNDCIEIDQNIAFVETDMRNYHVQAKPMIDERGVTEGFMTFFCDTTEYMNAKKDAERANNAKSDFLATISHEIRTPMSAIIGISSMMRDTTLSVKQLEYLKRIENASNVMLDLINEILDFTKAESGKFDIIIEPFDLKELLSGLDSTFTLINNHKGLFFELQVAEEVPVVVNGDPKRIRQVLTNILNNATKYTMEGGVILRVSHENAHTLTFEVIDTGIGISSEDHDKVFDPFVQVDQAKNKNIIGTGLGLSITKKLVELMGGTISLKSVYGKGTTFTITLDLETGNIEDIFVPQIYVTSYKIPDAKILIVDDVDINLEIVSYMLDDLDADIITAENGLLATKIAKKEKFDMILMDHMMPVMDGIEATKKIRESCSHNKEVPIIALTANAITGNDDMFASKGFTDFISKPIDRVKLLTTIHKYISKELIESI
ncbi:MAG: response regulator [Clostridiales Family XIII bacterium]|jgi:signal transduction histidine kinase/CheY-like chemotaxis protein|nr:response regulator [Clostridiales Family XIII bacterium]